MYHGQIARGKNTLLILSTGESCKWLNQFVLGTVKTDLKYFKMSTINVFLYFSILKFLNINVKFSTWHELLRKFHIAIYFLDIYT